MQTKNKNRTLTSKKLRLRQTGEKGIEFKRLLNEKLIEHKKYTNKNGQDMPEILTWRWAPSI